MAYSRQFVEDVSNALPERFHVFFNAYKKKLAIAEDDYFDFVQSTLEEKFESKTTKDKLIPVIRRLKKSANNKRQYLYTRFLDYASRDITDKKHPMNFIVALPSFEFYARFGDKTIPEVLHDYTEAVVVWKNLLDVKKNIDMIKANLMLIDFPVLDFIKNSVLLDCFKIDISLTIWEYIEKEMKGDISSYDFSTLQEFIGKPVWTSGPLTKKLDKIGDDLYETAIQDDDGQLLLTFQSREELAVILAEDGRAVIDYLIRMLDDISVLSADREYEIPLRTITNQLVPYNANAQVLARTKNVLRYLANITYVYNDEENHKETIFHILNAVTFIETGSKENVRIEISKEFQNEVIDRRLVPVKAKEYHLLENNLSRSIIHALKREQYLHANDVGVPIEYSYMFFVCNVYFESANKKDNMQLIANSLKEFKDKQIIIDDFVLKRDIFYIKFLPL